MSFFSFLADFLSPPDENDSILKVDIRYITDSKSSYSYRCPFFDDEQWSFDHLGSRRATQTSDETGAGIFSQIESVVWFWRSDFKVRVDLGSVWSLDSYDDPVAEIYRRINLVEQAFTKNT